MPWADLVGRCNAAMVESFGAEVSYISDPEGTPVTTEIQAPFDAYTQVEELNGDLPVLATRPTLDVRLSDLPSMPVRGDRADVTALDGTIVSYYVTEVRPDGGGMAQLYLAEWAEETTPDPEEDPDGERD